MFTYIFPIKKILFSPQTDVKKNVHLRIVDELADSFSEASAPNKEDATATTSKCVLDQAEKGRELLGELLRLVATLLASGPVHREEFLQVRENSLILVPRTITKETCVKTVSQLRGRSIFSSKSVS